MSEGKRKNKSYYVQNKRQKQGHVLEPGLRGFLVTCNNREAQAVRESYNILNEYADKLYGSDKPAEQVEEDEGEEDVEAALAREVKSLKSVKPSQRRFQSLESGANNCLFIRTTLEDPVGLAHHVFTDLASTMTAKSRFIMRLQPVAATCKAEPDKLRKLAQDLLPSYLGPGDRKTYCVLSKVRNNSTFEKKNILPILREVIQDLDIKHEFDGVKPDFVISVDIIKTMCCVSVMRDYFQLRKYNMAEVVKPLPVKEAGAMDTSSKEKNDTVDVSKTASDAQSDNPVPVDLSGSNATDVQADNTETTNNSSAKADCDTAQNGSDSVCDSTANEKDHTSGKLSTSPVDSDPNVVKSESNLKDANASVLETQPGNNATAAIESEAPI